MLPLPETPLIDAPETPVVVSARSPVSTPVTLSLNVTVNCTEAALAGFTPARMIELTTGGVVSGNAPGLRGRTSKSVAESSLSTLGIRLRAYPSSRPVLDANVTVSEVRGPTP